MAKIVVTDLTTMGDVIGHCSPSTFCLSLKLGIDLRKPAVDLREPRIDRSSQVTEEPIELLVGPPRWAIRISSG